MRQHTSAYVSMRQHTSAYVSILRLRVVWLAWPLPRRFDVRGRQSRKFGAEDVGVVAEEARGAADVDDFEADVFAWHAAPQVSVFVLLYQ